MRYREILSEGSSVLRWAYHGTLAANLPSIAQHGLQSNLRAKGPNAHWRAPKFNLLYFSLHGPDGWGVNQDPTANGDQLAEIRFPIGALKGVRWREDMDREGRDEYYAISRNEFSVPPSVIEVLHDKKWVPLLKYVEEIF